MVVAILTGLLTVATLLFYFALGKKLLRERVRPSLEAVIFSGIASFFDTLGIGNFAPTTAYLKFRRLVPDDLIPATLMVGYATATVTEAMIFITVIKIDPLLLALCIVASILGAFLGVSITARLPVRPIRMTMGIGLLIAATMYALSNLGLMPAGGSATALTPVPFAFAVIVNFVLGVLMNLGIGNYAPALIILSLLGLDPHAAFPIMMGSGAFLMVTSGVKLIADRPLNLRIIFGMAVGAIPAVLIAAFIVRTLPLDTLRWAVVVVVTYAGAVMLYAALSSRAHMAEEVLVGASLPPPL